MINRQNNLIQNLACQKLKLNREETRKIRRNQINVLIFLDKVGKGELGGISIFSRREFWYLTDIHNKIVIVFILYYYYYF